MYKITVYWFKSRKTYVYKARTLKDVDYILDDYRDVKDIKIKIKHIKGGTSWKN